MLIADAPRLQTPSYQTGEALMPSSRLLRLLLIEDIDELQAILRFTLETLSGWQVVTAKSTQDWLSLVKTEVPDVILLDGNPNHSNSLTQLKNNPWTRDIPVVCLVARDRLADQLQAKRVGAAAIVSKPFDPVTLIETVSAVVQQSGQ